MYRISTPISIANPRFEAYYKDYIEQFKKAKVDRVFLCAAQWTSPESEKQRVIALLKKYIPRIRAEGFEVGIWINSLGHGGTCGDFVNTDTGDGLTRMVSLDGQTNMGAYCPLCDNLKALAADWIKRLGMTEPDLIMMDDDYRYAFRNGGIFCACEKHRALFTQELGEEFDPARMKKALTEGGPNHWRDTWLKVQGKSLNDFAAMLRRSLDETAPHVRMSICSVLSTWDIDGVDSMTLARTLAGDTAPYLRLIGAPYWAALRSFQEIKLGAVCEYERLQQHWCKDSGIEIFCEGDSYPRPRYSVPAAYLEGFDQVMRAAGTNDGILKYMFDYVSSPRFETGYLDMHIENQPLYDIIHSAFEDKQSVGVTVYAPMKTLSVSHMPLSSLDDRCIPAALRFVTDTSLPVQYDAGSNAAFIFGDAGELADETQLKHGAVLDIVAAQALTRRGFDVGLSKINGIFAPNSEEYAHEDEVVGVVGGEWYDVTPTAGARIDSWQVYSEEGKADIKHPAVYTYENANGQRFAVYCFNAQTSFETGHNRGLFRSWRRASQIRRILPWLSGHPLDAVCDAAPELYMMTKRDGDSLSVGLWNFGVDKVARPQVRLGDEWTELKCHIGEGELNGKTVTLTPLAPFECAVFTLKK
ncbi:MAG: hypothetical protein IJC56_02415 [Clostridia bacterium]|nr:hypothetical protein [Clostridia bacterium]